jgi:hypothetical protein
LIKHNRGDWASIASIAVTSDTSKAVRERHPDQLHHSGQRIPCFMLRGV